MWPLIAGCLALLLLSQVQAATETIAAAPGTGASTAQCLAQGLSGQCNSCVCCCYSGSSAFINYEPTAQCTCKRGFDADEIKLAVVLAVIVLVPTLLTSCYLDGQLWISPYKKIRRQSMGDGSALQISPERQRGPEPHRSPIQPRRSPRRQTSSPLGPRQTVELTARTGP